MSINIETHINIASWFIDTPAERYPLRHAILGGHTPVTYRELKEITDGIGATLLNVGCSPGDRVLLFLSDSVEFIASFFGSAKIGAIPVPVSPWSQPSDYAYYISDTAARIAIVHSSALTQLGEVPQSESIKVILLDESERGRFENVQKWKKQIRDSREELKPFPSSARDPAVFMYTSGSTGRQKAVVHSHNSLIAASESLAKSVFAMDSHDRIMSLSKPFFSFGLGFGVYFPLSVGASTVVDLGQLKPEKIAHSIECYRPTILVGVPSTLAILLKVSKEWLALNLSSLRFIISAGEPLPAQVFEGFRDKFGVEVLDGIGSTEMLTHFISNRPRQARLGSCGFEVPGCEVKLLAEDAQQVPDGQVGSLWVKSEWAFSAYWNKPELTAQTQAGGWTSTGDKLYRDSDGYYHYCGRNDDMLKIKGVWVTPREIEEAIRKHPSVERCFVTTCEDHLGIRRLVAYVVIVVGLQVSSTDLLKHIGALLPAHMLPSALMFLPEFPLTLNGKVNRPVLPLPTWNTKKT